jgi:1,4-dihydroxy-2-naphthoyl-CoA hydrolase
LKNETYSPLPKINDKLIQDSLPIWKHKRDPEFINSMLKNTSVEVLGIIITEIGDDFLVGRMPVDHRTIQPHGILHGGATVHLAETLGSVASTMCIDNPLTTQPVGVEINANHLKTVHKGDTVEGIVRPIRIGKRMHIWEIKVYNGQKILICISRFSVMIVDKSMGF